MQEIHGHIQNVVNPSCIAKIIVKHKTRPFGEGVERTFALYSPNVDSIKVIRSGKVRRAKLYYLRDRKGKSARIAEKIKKKIGVDVSVKSDESKVDQVESAKQETKKEENQEATPKAEAKKQTSEKK